jgi:hypothetical protein
MIHFVVMGWLHMMFVLVLLNIHKICLKLKSGFRIIRKFPMRINARNSRELPRYFSKNASVFSLPAPDSSRPQGSSITAPR